LFEYFEAALVLLMVSVDLASVLEYPQFLPLVMGLVVLCQGQEALGREEDGPAVSQVSHMHFFFAHQAHHCA